MLAITGCGRSGTVYTSKLLQSCGIMVGHEQMARDGIVSWWIAGDYWTPKGESWQEVLEFTPIVLHQVRNPLDCISSITTIKPKSWQYIGKHIPLTNDVLKNAMAYYLFWNIRAQERACFSYQIEHMGDHWVTIMKLAGYSPRQMPIHQSNINSREHKRYTWKDLKRCDPSLCEQIREYAHQFYNSNLLF
jgi:hypothetical protein